MQASQPNTRLILLRNVDSSAGYRKSDNKGEVFVTPPPGGWPTGTAYQINLVQDSEHLDAVLAQSQQFNIVHGSGLGTGDL